MARPRLVLADDHTLILEGMRRVLQPHFDLVGFARDGRALVKVVKEMRPDVVLVDIGMPLLNGIDAARQIRKLSPETKIVFLTMHADRDYIIEAFRAGASGYLIKSSAEEELTAAIELVLRGKVYVTHELPEELQGLAGKLAGTRGKKEPGLSLREREVLQLVAEGRTAKEIASILFLSAKTIEYHKYKLMRTLGLHTAAELATYAVQKTLLGLKVPSESQTESKPEEQ